MLNTHYNRQLVRDFIHAINPEIMVQFGSNEFYVYIDEKLVNVTFNNEPLGDYLFHEFIEEHFHISANPFLMGILHEIGHIFTYDEKTNHEREVLYYMLQCNFKEEEFDTYTKMYFAIPSEFNATKWGVEYYLTHKDFCDTFLNRLED